MIRFILLIMVLLIGLIACSNSTETSTDSSSVEVSTEQNSSDQLIDENESVGSTGTIGSMSDVGEMAEKRIEFTGVALPDGRAVVMGGVSEGASQGYSKAMSKTAEVFDPATGTWAFIAEPVMASGGCIVPPENYLKEFLRRGGLICEILNSGTIKVGDEISIL